VTVPEAVSSALGAVESLVVRSSLVAARFTDAAVDLRQVAAECEVDVVLTGTLLRAADQLRVTTQLAEAPEGTLVWSHSSVVAQRDVFQLQDDLVTRIVDGLSIPLTAREQRRLHGDVPATTAAYECYLRANRLAADPATWADARALYERCVGEDPRFAPAWARLGRVYRLLAKYRAEDVFLNLDRSEAAFRRALELNPELPVAHDLFTYFEVEAGRARDAMVRLLQRVRGGTADPALFGGLVTACRYCGLLGPSLAADAHARRLDPNARTSVAYTHWLRGDYAQAVATETQDPPFVKWYAWAEMGREAEAVEATRALAGALGPAAPALAVYRAAILGHEAEVRAHAAELVAQGFRDPEGLFFVARALARVGAGEEAVALLAQVVDAYTPADALAGDAWLRALQDHPRWPGLLQHARDRRDAAAAAYREAGGPATLGAEA
jgi:tetratricopeptide (TPR) repeat protein